MVYCGLSNRAIFRLLEWPGISLTYCKHFQIWFFVSFCSSWQDCNRHSLASASRGPSAKALLSLLLLTGDQRGHFYDQFRRTQAEHRVARADDVSIVVYIVFCFVISAKAREYVFTGVGLSVCLSVITAITKKLWTDLHQILCEGSS